MTEDAANNANEVSEMFQELIVSIGATMLRPLTKEQREYVLCRAHNEFRFWRIEDELS